MAHARSSLPRPAPSRRSLSRHALAVAALLAATGLAAAQSEPLPGPDRRIDPQTGRDMRVWPPDVLFDYQKMRLEVEIPDMHRAWISGRCTLHAAPIGSPRDAMRLDAGPAISVKAITVDGAEAPFSHKNSTLTIDLPRPYAPGEPVTVVIDYEADKPGGRGAGLTFSKDDPDTPEDDPMCHAQGQPESNHLWFPCHDFPNMRLATEVIATVPEGYTAISNGRLVEVSKNPATGRWRYHWDQQLPHATYLVTLVVGKFDVVDVGGPDSARPGLWMPVYGPLGSAKVLERNFGNTPEMVAFFEELLDEPYPWDKFANVVCRDFAAGAMENTSAVTWAPFAATAPLGVVEGVNAHELLHHWFGDLVTYTSWEHLWLSEGWATYGEALWSEHTRGDSGYMRAMARNAGQIRAMARGSRPWATGMVTNLYTSPEERFYAAENPYQKGGWIIHALRSRLGDEVFWAGVRAYIARHKFSNVETDDLRIALEEASGESLERFFDQFVLRPGLPRLNVDLAWDDSAATLTVAARQTQRIDADNPAYAFSLPILVTYAGGDHEYLWLDMDARDAQRAFPLREKPAKVVLDPRATVPAVSQVTTELAWLVEQLRTGPTPYAQLVAAESLAAMGGLDAARVLAASAAAWKADPLVRAASARALAGMARADAAAIMELARAWLPGGPAIADASGGER